MELSVRDWMIIVGVLLVMAVLLDGYRRMRQERRNQIRMSLSRNATGGDNSADSPTNPELPSGRARVVPRSQSEPRRRVEPRLDDAVPVLMEPAEHDGVEPEPELETATEPEPEAEAATPVQEPPETDAVTAQSDAAPGPAEEVLVINVLARDEPFAGPELLQILLTCDLRYGKMNIFHRYEQAGGQGPVQFSVANIVEPGTFDLDDIDSFNTRGVCFFLTLPGPRDPLTAFDYMVETAQCLVRNLNGELRDEAHSVMTAQTLEHCRARIREFERRQLTQHHA